jgi:hypothetical protein
MSAPGRPDWNGRKPPKSPLLPVLIDCRGFS